MTKTALTAPFALAALLLAAATLVAGGCGDDATGNTCERNDDCGAGQLCTGGRCIDTTGRSCRDSNDCAPGESCTDNICVSADTDTPDAGDDATDQGLDVVPDVRPDVPVPDAVDEEVSESAPEIVSVTPANGDTGVGVDSVIVIQWDQPMDGATFTAANLNLEDWSGNALERRITYNAPTREVSLAPVDSAGFFASASPYILTIAREVRGANGLNPAGPTVVTFYTEAYEDMAAYQALAEAYAPVVYAEVRAGSDVRDATPHIDWFTSLDLDGDLDVTDNLEYIGNRNNAVPAHVYWNVLETETHYLIQYVFYFAGGVRDDNDLFDDAVPHDFAYSTVVVQKRDDDVLGAFVLAEGLGDGQVYAYALSAYPTECGGEAQPPCQGASPETNLVWVEFDGAALEPATDGDDEPGRRYPAYISQATHASCLQPAFEPEAFRAGNRCAHLVGGEGPFFEDNAEFSRILRPGAGDDWTSGDSENIELTYALSPFLDLWWTQRANTSIWDDSRSYTVPPGGAGTGSVKVPSSFATDEEVGPVPGRRAPFQVDTDAGRTCGGCSTIGVWFVDPVWEILGHVDFDHEFSDAYCFNPYLGIDRRGEVGCGGTE